MPLILLAPLVGLGVLMSPTKGVNAQQAPLSAQPVQAQAPRLILIDGAVTPELISEYQAYSMLFRLVAKRVGQERAAIRAYLRQIGMGAEKCATCGNNAQQVESQIDLLIGAAEEFVTRVTPLDVKMKEASETAPTATVETQLASLRHEKEGICREISGSLVLRLGAADAEKVRLHVEGMKRRMKVVQ